MFLLLYYGMIVLHYGHFSCLHLLKYHKIHICYTFITDYLLPLNFIYYYSN